MGLRDTTWLLAMIRVQTTNVCRRTQAYASKGNHARSACRLRHAAQDSKDTDFIYRSNSGSLPTDMATKSRPESDDAEKARFCRECFFCTTTVAQSARGR